MTAERERRFWQECLRPERIASNQSISIVHGVIWEEDKTRSLDRVLRLSTQEEDLSQLWSLVGRLHCLREREVKGHPEVRIDQANECRYGAVDGQSRLERNAPRGW